MQLTIYWGQVTIKNVKKTIACEQFNIKEKDQKYSESADLHQSRSLSGQYF